MCYADINGTRLHYEYSGVGETVVLIHGWSFDLRCWDEQVPALAGEYSVLRYDLRGFGCSDLPSPGVAYSHIADLIELLNYLGIRRAHILGHSFGGRIAIDFALRYPERVLSLILPDSATDMLDPPQSAELDNWIIGTWQTGEEQGVEAAKKIWLNGPPLEHALQNPHAAEKVRRMVADYSGWHWRNADPQMEREMYPAEHLAEIKAPTLILVGGDNLPAYHETGCLQNTYIPDSQLVTIPGVGHVLNIEDAERFNAEILRFLRGISTNQTVTGS